MQFFRAGSWRGCALLTWLAGAAGAQTPTNLFFLHHSTGDGLVAAGRMRETIEAHNQAYGTACTFWDHGYNYQGLRNAAGEETGISYEVPHDNTDPDGLHYLFTAAAADAANCRQRILANHQVIAFKSCFPASAIGDEAELAQYESWYLEMRTAFDQRPDRLFVVMSTPPLHRLSTTAADAARARRFADWLKSDAYLGGRSNVVCFDLFDHLADSNHMLKYEYEGSHDEGDSHPNEAANLAVGPVFALFLVNAAQAFHPTPSPTPPVPARRVMNDFDGDGLTDRALFSAESGEWLAALSYTASNRNQSVGGPGGVPAAGDYDGDGLTDPAVFDPAAGRWTVLLSASGFNPVTASLGGPAWLAAPGDFDGDGLTDPAVCRESTGDWTVMLSASQYGRVSGWLGGPGCLPAVGDFDGDGLTDPAVYRESTGHWGVLLSGSAYTLVTATLGGPGQAAAPGDYDGDGLTDPAVYQASTGRWTVRLSAAGYSQVSATLGGAGCVPASGDYDGDGLTDPAVYRAAAGRWTLRLSGAGYTPSTANQGGPGYTPVYAGYHR